MKIESNLMEMSEEELLVEIGKRLDRGMVGAFPKPIPILKQRGEKFFQSNLGKCRETICPNKTIQELAQDGYTIELISAVAGLIESLTISVAVTPLAILLCKKGLFSLCQESWNLNNSRDDNEVN